MKMSELPPPPPDCDTYALNEVCISQGGESRGFNDRVHGTVIS